MAHTLQIDESGDFSDPYYDVTVTAVVITHETRPTLRRLDATFQRGLSFLPRPAGLRRAQGLELLSRQRRNYGRG